MERRKASDLPPEVLKLFDGYVHGAISRRDFLDRAGKYAIGGFTAAAMLESLRPNYAFAQQVAKDDARIKTEYLSYPSPQGSGTMRGYFARPVNPAGKLPDVVVIHENRGLNPYIEDVTRRLAVANFIAFAPDALAPLGGYPGDEEKAATLFGQFYGGQPNASDVARIKAPLMIHYAGLDERINSGWPAYEAALKANGIKYEMFMYANTNHGFHNDTTPRYDEAAAKLAWSRTIEFLDRNLRT